MDTTTRLLAGLATATILLTGCSASGWNVEPALPEPAAAPAGGGVAADRAESGSAPAGGQTDRGVPYTTGTERQIARTASLTLVVDDVSATAERIRALTATLDGWVAGESLALDPGDGARTMPAGSYLTLSVPASRLDDAIRQVGELGTVRDRNATAEDVTDVVVDLDARIRSLEASVNRLQDLVGRAGSVADIAAVERELSARQADLEAMKSQRLRLAGAVERSTLTVALLTPTQSTTTNPIQTGWSQGWNAFLRSVAALITFVAAVLPFALFFGLIALPVWLVVRRRRTRTSHTAGTGRSAASGDFGPDRVDVGPREQDRPGGEGQRQDDADDGPQ
ncbi:MAG TPA: DUF4349 domain-containing protein [Propionibacterium sp.]|nr:DUF4349 domain-containing protein [Propionibacterium sp.]